MAATGDTRAFAAIYERYHQPIYRYCHSILHDPEDAADALQNTMVKAMRGLAGNDRDIALKPWLFRIAHNEAISLVRRRRPTASLESIEVPLAPSVDDDAATRERLQQLVADLHELPERQRGALLMRELAGLEFAEIAQIFDVSAAAAKQTVYEARTALHEYVEGRRMLCEDARQALSVGDRRMLRGRKLSAHLRGCSSCRDFEEIMRLRRRDVAALAPPISAAGSAAILKGILGSAAGGSVGTGGFGTLVSGSSAKALVGSQGAKSLLVAAVVTAGAGALGVVSTMSSQDQPARVAPIPSRAESLPAGSGDHARSGPAATDRQGGSVHKRSSRHHSSRTTSSTGGTSSGTGSASVDGSGGESANGSRAASGTESASNQRRSRSPLPHLQQDLSGVVGQVTSSTPALPASSDLPQVSANVPTIEAVPQVALPSLP
jgi:RNA polymerase sigma factor (sigma-70 family)